MTQGLLPGRVLGALVTWTLPPECFSPELTSPPPQHRIKPSASSSARGCSLTQASGMEEGSFPLDFLLNEGTGPSSHFPQGCGLW